MPNRLRKVKEIQEEPFHDTVTEVQDSTNREESIPGKKSKKNKNTSEQEELHPTKNQTLKEEKNGSLIKKFFLFYQSAKVRIIWGLILLAFSVYLPLSMVFYYLNYENDFAALTLEKSDFFVQEVTIRNPMGKAGAWLSHRLIFEGYGIFSFLWAVFFMIWGLKRAACMQIFASVPKILMHLIFWMITGSLVMNLTGAFTTKWSGNSGFVLMQWMLPYIGKPGIWLLVLITCSAYGIIYFNIHHIPERIKNWVNDKEENIVQKNVTNENVPDKSMTEENADEPLSDEELEEQVNPDDIHIELKEILEESGIGMSHSEESGKAGEAHSDTEKSEEENNTVIAEETKKDEEKVNAEAGFEIVNTTEKQEEMVQENAAAKLVEELGEFDPTLELSSYRFPEFDLLNDYGNMQGKLNEEEIIANKNRIISTLRHYGIEIERITATVGPTVTLYEVVPAAGIRIAKIKNLENDIALSLSAMGIRIIAPIPGKGTVGIEVPNTNPEIVPMRNILASEKFNSCTYELPIALGKTISNEIYIADLTKMPHLLMAGATGQGKSVGLNAILVSLLYKKHPAQIKFVLVDPKKVELTLFNKIERHYLARLPNSEEAIITDTKKVIHTLNSLCIEMDNRYALLQDAAARNIREYNQKFIQRRLNPQEGHKFLPYIVVVIDEFADLIMTAGKEIEMPIARLAQLARAVGIHLIIATQRPSVNIITGVIKANFPARIAFRVSSKIDSRTILDTGGAEQLIGRGDMLLSTGNELIRIQCAFVDTPEVERITEFIGSQRGYPSPFLLPEYVDENEEAVKEEVDLSSRDKMFDEAARLVVQFQQGSASFLQRKLKLGYNRAGRIVDQLEAAGIVGPFEGSKAREVLIKDMQQLEEILKNL